VSGNLNIAYTFSFVTPDTDQFIDITVPISLSGTVNAIGQDFQTLWTVTVTGNGTAELSGYLSGGILRFDNVTISYTGTGSVGAQ
jgi:hypothetical protein